MVTKEELALELAATLAEKMAQGAFGPDGPELDCDIDDIEDVAVLAARAAFDAVLARALQLQNQRLPDKLRCPTCSCPCPVKYEQRTIRGRLGSATIREPICHCYACERDFFPSTGSVAAG